MIARIRPIPRPKATPAWHSAFLALLPKIVAYARIAFRCLKPEAREDAIQEVVANALVAFARLVELGKADLAYPTVLARYGIAQFRDGRRVGNRLRINDVLSPYCQRKRRLDVERLDKFDREEGVWMESVVPDNRRPVPDQAAFRIDFPAWLRTLSSRDRRIAVDLAAGRRTGDVATKHDLSPARVSQLRQEFLASWREFHGEPASPKDR